MRAVLLILLISCACNFTQAQDIITTIAGTGVSGFCCDSEQATVAEITVNSGVCLDNFGNLYIGDGGNARIRKVNLSTGIITTIAGNGTPNYNGDNIPAINAEFAAPEAVLCDTAGNIFIADADNNRIRKITASTGIITTIAGIGPTGAGAGGAAGDGGQATDAQLNGPSGICFDGSYNLYIADYGNDKVRKVDAVTGIITTFAGIGVPLGYTGGFVGYSGDSGPATNAQFSGPIRVFADSVDNIYVCDLDNHVIRKVSAATGIITTIAGNGTSGYSGNNGPASAALLNHPAGIFIDKRNNIFIAEFGNGVVRRIDGTTEIITTVAGNGHIGYSGDDSIATNAKLDCGGVVLDNHGTMYIADMYNYRVRMVYDPKLAVPVQNVSKDAVKVYPNPTQNEITIAYTFANSGDGTLHVMDITGRVVASKNLSNQKQEEEINIGGLSNGLYLYKVVQNGILISAGKLVKE